MKQQKSLPPRAARWAFATNHALICVLAGGQIMTRIIPSAVFLAGLTAITAVPAEAVVYCTYVGVPAGCVARPGVALRAAPGVGVAPGVGAGAAGPGVAPGTPANRGGPVNRVGRH